MMQKFAYMKRRTKGAISIFLILIFVATYMISGLLVDGGRYRMAQVMAETALDSATESVLSYYNQMLYDLYGLFAVDNNDVAEENIAEILENYVSKTLQTADIDYDDYATNLTDWLLSGSWSDEEKEYFNDYGFTIAIENSGASVTLANTDYVEDQIVEHMKYRAPVEMVTQTDGFIDKLSAIVDMKDRLAASKEQITITNKHENLFEDAAKLMEDINAFNERMIAFCVNPEEPKSFKDSMADGNAGNLYDLYGKAFDERLLEISGYLPEVKGDDENGEKIYETEEEVNERKRRDYEEAVENFIADLKSIFENAESLYNEANTLRKRIDDINNQYNAYIGELQAELNKDPNNDQSKTVYEPAIELAKSNCGEILKNVDLILSSRQYTYELVEFGEGSYFSALDVSLERIYENRLNGGSPISIKEALNKSQNQGLIGESIYLFFSSAQGDLNALMSQTSYFYKCHSMEVNVKNGDVVVDKEPKTEKEENKKPEPADLKAEHLAIAYKSTKTYKGGEDYSLDEDITTKNSVNILDAGLSLIDTIAGMVEGVRDNLYVNEYIMTTFPNIVGSKIDVEKELTALQQKRKDYNATIAGVEYILIGGTDSSANVLLVDAELLGIRTIFNTAAIFTDVAKVNQATAIAASISGPFAPLVTVGLLLAWAVAESALDVVHLKDGEEVPLFKNGKDWYLSVEGAVAACIEELAAVVADEAADLLSNIKTQFKNTAQGVIYDLYNTAQGTKDQIMNQAVSGAKEEVNQLATEIVNNCGNDAACSELMNNISSEFDHAVSQVQNEISGWGDNIFVDARDSAIKAINESMDTTFSKVEKTAKKQIDKFSDKIKESIKGKVPIGEVVNTGNSATVKLDYEDYLRFLLLMMSQKSKMERIQSLIQANMIHGGNKTFKMEDSSVAIWADMDCEIRYLFMSNAILPANVKRDGRMTFTVHSARSY